MTGNRSVSACCAIFLAAVLLCVLASQLRAQELAPAPQAAPVLQSAAGAPAAAIAPASAVIPTAPVPKSQTAESNQQVNQELQQRLLGLVPNFLVVYTPRPVPLTTRQKFKLAFRSAIDPMGIVADGASAAYGQAINDPKEFGQGARGYGKRLGFAYGADVFGTMTGKAVLPSLLKQDPRYFYRGTGSVASRFFYAVSNTLICMGDNGHWQVNVSGNMGGLATAGMTEFEYPPSDRYDVIRVFRNFVLSRAGSGAANVFQEFFSRRLTFQLKHPKP